MPKVAVYTVAGQQISDLELNESVFGVEVNEALHSSGGCYAAGSTAVPIRMQRQKSGGLVRGGGRKPWKQKGTGRARSGSTRSPIWVGGGTVFGPTPRSYAFRMPRKQRRLAIKCALFDKVQMGDFVVLENLDFAAPKTKDVVKMLNDFSVQQRRSSACHYAETADNEKSLNIPGKMTILSVDECI